MSSIGTLSTSTPTATTSGTTGTSGTSGTTSAPTLSFSGLASGIDTSSIITALTQLNQKQINKSSQVQ